MRVVCPVALLGIALGEMGDACDKAALSQDDVLLQKSKLQRKMEASVPGFAHLDLHPAIQDFGASGCSPSKPCGVCEGDCDRDEDCLGNLRCFQRDGLSPVPGCRGGSAVDHDYCYHATGPLLTDRGDVQGPCTRDDKCGMCEGSCTSDDQCDGDLKCFKRPEGTIVDGVAPPGCTGGGDGDRPGYGYCFSPEPPLVFSGVSGCSPDYPCEVCTGDCDSDADCAEGLTCFQRDGFTKVPGCAGGGMGDGKDLDYCVRVCPDYSGKWVCPIVFNEQPATLTNDCKMVDGSCGYSNQNTIESQHLNMTFPTVRRSYVTDGAAWIEQFGFMAITSQNPPTVEFTDGVVCTLQKVEAF